MTVEEIERRIDEHVEMAKENLTSPDEDMACLEFEIDDPISIGIWSARRELIEELRNSNLNPEILEQEIAKVEALTQFTS